MTEDSFHLEKTVHPVQKGDDVKVRSFHFVIIKKFLLHVKTSQST
jgi:hypothetical protein